MCGKDPKEALGWPPGSVRAILAIIIIPCTTIGSIILMCLMFWKQQYTSAMGILSGLTGLAGAVVGYYFGTKSAQKATDEIIKAHDEVRSKNYQIEAMKRENLV